MNDLRFAICDLRFFSWLRNGIVLAVLFLAVNLSNAATNDFFAQGVELGRAGHFSDAAGAFEKSAQTRPAAGTLVNLGIAEWQRGQNDAAAEATRLKPKSQIANRKSQMDRNLLTSASTTMK